MAKTKAIEATNEVAATSTALVETPQTEVSLSRALHITTKFASEAVLTGSDAAPRRLTWMTGLSECFAMNGKQALPAARAWVIDQPDEEAGLFPEDYELIEAMQFLCEQGIARECLIVHPDRETGKPRRVPSWQMPQLSLFVVCEGVPGKNEMIADPAWRCGVAYGRPSGDGKSILIFQAFVKELMDAGYSGVFQCSFSSYLSDAALRCLKSQEYVINFASTLRAAAGEHTIPAFYAYALPIRCSDKTMTAGRQVGKTKEIYYPIPAIPQLSRHKPQESLAYLQGAAITDEQLAIVEAGGRVELARDWSVERSKKIIAGNADAAADEGPDAPFPTEADAPF